MSLIHSGPQAVPLQTNPLPKDCQAFGSIYLYVGLPEDQCVADKLSQCPQSTTVNSAGNAAVPNASVQHAMASLPDQCKIAEVVK